MSAINIAEAKTQLTKLIHRAEQGESVHLSRHGKPVAVLISEQEYASLLARRADPFGAMMAWRAQTDFADDDLSDDEIDSWRNREVERGFAWED